VEKTYALEQKEAQQLGQLDQERTQALAVVGALSLDMETARKNLEAIAERQRSYLRMALDKRGVERFDNARIQNGEIIVNVPDQAAPEAIPMKANGSPARELKAE
jgi:hypothetical protein